MTERMGLIAGDGKLPIIFAREAKRRGIEVIGIGHIGETDISLEGEVQRLHWVRIGEAGKIIEILLKEKVNKAIMLGKIIKTRMFEKIYFDELGLRIFTMIKDRKDDSILKAMASEMEKRGIYMQNCLEYLEDFIVPSGCLTKRKPTIEEMEDVTFGWSMAKEIGRLDIGQSVVVKAKTVVAVESIEGTDEAIRRGGILSNGGCCVIKVSKPQQDWRFDVPAVGAETVKVMAEVGARVLTLEAGKTIMIDKDETVRIADQNEISIIGINGDVEW